MDAAPTSPLYGGTVAPRIPGDTGGSTWNGLYDGGGGNAYQPPPVVAGPPPQIPAPYQPPTGTLQGFGTPIATLQGQPQGLTRPGGDNLGGGGSLAGDPGSDFLLPGGQIDWSALLQHLFSRYSQFGSSGPSMASPLSSFMRLGNHAGV